MARYADEMHSPLRELIAVLYGTQPRHGIVRMSYFASPTRPARHCATKHLRRTLQYGTPSCIMRRTLYAMVGGMASILSDLQAAGYHT